MLFHFREFIMLSAVQSVACASAHTHPYSYICQTHNTLRNIHQYENFCYYYRTFSIVSHVLQQLKLPATCDKNRTLRAVHLFSLSISFLFLFLFFFFPWFKRMELSLVCYATCAHTPNNTHNIIKSDSFEIHSSGVRILNIRYECACVRRCKMHDTIRSVCTYPP